MGVNKLMSSVCTSISVVIPTSKTDIVVVILDRHYDHFFVLIHHLNTIISKKEAPLQHPLTPLYLPVTLSHHQLTLSLCPPLPFAPSSPFNASTLPFNAYLSSFNTFLSPLNAYSSPFKTYPSLFNIFPSPFNASVSSFNASSLLLKLHPPLVPLHKPLVPLCYISYTSLSSFTAFLSPLYAFPSLVNAFTSPFNASNLQIIKIIQEMDITVKITLKKALHLHLFLALFNVKNQIFAYLTFELTL